MEGKKGSEAIEGDAYSGLGVQANRCFLLG